MHTAAKAALDGWTGPYTTMDGLGGMGGMCWPTVGLLDSLSLQITPIRCCGPLLAITAPIEATKATNSV